MTDLVLAIDQGTSATKACLWEPPDRLLSSHRVAVKRYSPHPGQVEQDPDELVESCREAAAAALSKARARPRDVAAAAIANQGESFLLVDDDGAVSPVIGWQDTRCGTVLEDLSRGGAERVVARLTGLPAHAEFPAPKLAYWLQQGFVPAGSRFATLDTWLMSQFDPQRPYVTDRATASRTMLVELDGTDWSPELLEIFQIPRDLLPTIVPCDSPGACLAIDGFEIPIWASGYDTGLALLGHGLFEAGEAKASFGTCLGVMAGSGPIAQAADGLLTTVAYTRGRQPVYALDGEIAAAGALVNWAIGLGVADSLDQMDRLAASVGDTGGAVIVPAISGLGAPHWRDDVRGAVYGLTEAFGRAHFARATFDAIAWSLRDVLEALKMAGVEVAELGVDGGLTRSQQLMQRCADVCGVPLLIPSQTEATAYGAAVLAMVSHELASADDVHNAVGSSCRTVTPSLSPPSDEEARWRSALAQTLRSAHE